MGYVMKSHELVNKLKDIANKYKTLYVSGGWGAPLTASNKERYIKNYNYNKSSERKSLILNASSDTFAFDCVCLIKGVLWGWCGDLNATNGGAVYEANGVPDVDEGTMINMCSNISADFGRIQIGEAVWLEGHIGVYIGDGLAVECTPIWSDGVQITAVGNIGRKVGYNTRNWTKHGCLPWIDYSKVVFSVPKSNIEIAREVIKGKWGNGAIRKTKLTCAGYDYSTIQNIVNGLCNGKTVYIVKKGDTLSKIAREHKTTVKRIATDNGIKDVNLINIGQELII